MIIMAPLMSSSPYSISSGSYNTKPLTAVTMSSHCLMPITSTSTGTSSRPTTTTSAPRMSMATTRSVSESGLQDMNTSMNTNMIVNNKGSSSGDICSLKPKRRISFDERVSVREFESNSLYLNHDSHQLSPIVGRTVIAIPQMILCPRGDGAISPVPFPYYNSNNNININTNQCPPSPLSVRTNSCGSSNSYINNRVINVKSTTSTSCMSLSLESSLHREIRRILMVDPHDIFLALFSKRLHQAMPHPVEILTAHSSDEALDLCSKHSFDVIITEERLSLFHRHTGGTKVTSGSALLGHLRQHAPQQFQSTLLIGVSAHWQTDHATMVNSGADYCWSKAPAPTLNKAMLEELLHTLLMKRGKHEVAKNLMVISSSGEISTTATTNKTTPVPLVDEKQ